MAAPTNTSFLTAIDLGTITNGQSTAVPTLQTVDDAGTTYTVYYSFTTPPSVSVMGAFAFGDLVTYHPSLEPYVGPAASPTPVNTGAVIAHNVPCQFTVEGNTQYFLEIGKGVGNPSPANLTLTVYVSPSVAVPVGSFAVNDDNDVDLPLALLSSATDYTALKFITPFPSGEAGDTLSNGTVLVEDVGHSDVKLYNSSYQEMPIAALAAHTIRTCITPQNFCVATSQNPTRMYTVSAAGTISAAEVLTAMTSCNAAAKNNLETILYHVFTGTNVAVRKWDLAGHAALADLAAGIANYSVVDILCPSGTDILVGYYKNTVTRDYKVLRYSAAGATLSTYSGFPIPSGLTSPRLAYAIDDPNSFWVMVPTSVTPGQTNFFNVKISDGSILTTRNHEQFENGTYGGTPTATPVAFFGAAFSCPFWITRAAQTTTATYPTRRLRRFLLPSSENNYRMFMSKLELLMETGLALTPDAWGSTTNSPQGANPQIMVRFSTDGGETWHPEQWRSAGMRGEYEIRPRWLKPVRAYRNAVCEVVVSDPVAWRLISAMGEFAEGSS